MLVHVVMPKAEEVGGDDRRAAAAAAAAAAEPEVIKKGKTDKEDEGQEEVDARPVDSGAKPDTRMKLIVGLGNPGSRIPRHAAQRRASWWSTRSPGGTS